MNAASIVKITCSVLLLTLIQACTREPQPQEPKQEAPAPALTTEPTPAAKGEIIIKTQEQLDEIIKTGNVVVDIHGEAWCGPCQMLAPVFKKIAEDTPNVTFAKVNVDEIKQPVLSGAPKFGGVPTLVFYKDGVFKELKTGALNEADLRDLIKKTFAL